MNHVNISKSIFHVTASNFFAKFIYGIIMLLIIRYSSYEEYADYTFYISIVSIVSGFFISGVNNVFITGHAELQDESSYVLSQIIFCIASIMSISMAYSLSYTSTLSLILLCTAMCLSEFIKTIYQQRLIFSKYIHVEISRVCIYAILIYFLLIYYQFNLFAHCVLFANAMAFF